PVSSTGHLIIVGELVGLSSELENTFEIVIQFGAVLAVIGFYWADLVSQLRGLRQEPDVRRLWLGIGIAFVPAAVVGLLLRDYITEYLFHPVPVGIALIAGGIVFLFMEWTGLADRTDDDISLEGITLRQALAVGLFQTLALVPGVSRSGASIVGGLVAGMNRTVATQFSFYLAIPTLGLATLYELLTSMGQLSSAGLVNIFIGAVVSGVVAWLSIGWLLRYVAQHTFVLFGYYRIVIGLIIVIFFQFQ
ncbi:MAG: undecaprenyl-diphosphate phosphatase, partial [Chloroflexota bacterium]